MAGTALGDSDFHFAWQAWHLCHWAGYSGALGSFGRRGCLHSRRGTWRQRSSLCMAGMALGDIDLHFAWQAWHLAISVFILRGRYVLVDRDLHFAWQARHLATGTFTLRGRHGTWLQRPSLCMAGVAVMSLGWLLVAGLGPLVAATICMAGVALGDSNLHFAWQARYLAISVFTLRGWCVVGDSDLHFAWQARHLATATFTLRGRCGTYGSVLALVTR